MDQRRLTTSGVGGLGLRRRGLNGRFAGFAIVLLAGVAMLAYGVSGHGRLVQLPEVTDDVAAEELAADDAISADWAAALDGDIFSYTAMLTGYDAAEEPADEPAPLAAPKLQWRSEFWLVEAATVGGVNRDDGGQLLQAYPEGEGPSLCPT